MALAWVLGLVLVLVLGLVREQELELVTAMEPAQEPAQEPETGLAMARDLELGSALVMGLAFRKPLASRQARTPDRIPQIRRTLTPA